MGAKWFTRVSVSLALALSAAASGCESSPPVVGCDTDEDCPASLYCAPGGCRTDCTIDTDCTMSGETCSARGRCTTGGIRLDGGPVPCTTDGDCSDGMFCTGVETCAAGACAAGTAPCTTACDETADRCMAGADADGDGDPASSDCDDNDALRFHGNVAETNRCDMVDNDCDPNTLGPDSDNDDVALIGCCNPQSDGTDLCGTDCDDTRDTINPDAVETCNFADDDCDGETDEAVLNTYYRDVDDDGYGTMMRGADDTRSGCTAPVGYVPLGTDCDDTLRTVNPGLGEMCNERDDNCDGMIDADPTASPPLACECSVGRVRACGPLDGMGLPNITGTCLQGTQECTTLGLWGACVGAVFPTVDSATGNPQEAACDGRDEDCDGMIDDDAPPPSPTCYSGPAPTLDVGVCHAGTYRCGGSGGWICMGEVTPGSTGPQCGTDTDCDGDRYDGATCEPTYAAYPGHAAHTADSQRCNDLMCGGTMGSVSCLSTCSWPAASACVRDGGRTCVPGSTIGGCARSCGTQGCTSTCTPNGACVYPAEVCDGVDNDCDGTVDNGLRQFLYYDGDGDGYGGGSVSFRCPAPGWITTGGDCRDSDIRVFQLVSARLDEDGDQYCNPNIGTVNACAGVQSGNLYTHAWATVSGVDTYFANVRVPGSCLGDECYSADWFGSDRNAHAPARHGCRYNVDSGAPGPGCGCGGFGCCTCSPSFTHTCDVGYQPSTLGGYNRCFAMVTSGGGNCTPGTRSVSGRSATCTNTQTCNGLEGTTCYSFITCSPCASTGC